jgi:D-methionine transport system ATP-binding protein
MEVIRKIADRVAVIDAGRIVEEGQVWSVFADPQARSPKPAGRHPSAAAGHIAARLSPAPGRSDPQHRSCRPARRAPLLPTFRSCHTPSASFMAASTISRTSRSARCSSRRSDARSGAAGQGSTISEGPRARVEVLGYDTDHV